MANLKESSFWEEGIYQWETSDPVLGGENGIDNVPTRQLANRTKWLKDNKLDKSATAASADLAKKAQVADKLSKARNVGGVAFDGTADIDLPGVNKPGNQDTSGNAATATKLQTICTINGMPFDGSTDINATPAGAIQFFAMETAPVGWLKANGAEVSRTLYANLFVAIGTTFGSGDGKTTFNLPDLRGEFLRGWDDGRRLDKKRLMGSTQNQQILDHSHNMEAWTSSINGLISKDTTITNSIWGGIPVVMGDGGVMYSDKVGISINPNYRVVGTRGVQDGAGEENRPRNVALLACIKI
nr:phage tail protein [Snodgrassella alvi]